jgi:hypothetical protein
MLLRVACSAEVEVDDCSSATSEAAGSSVSLASESDSVAELDSGDGEEELVPAGRGRWARRLFHLLVDV